MSAYVVDGNSAANFSEALQEIEDTFQAELGDLGEDIAQLPFKIIVQIFSPAKCDLCAHVFEKCQICDSEDARQRKLYNKDIIKVVEHHGPQHSRDKIHALKEKRLRHLQERERKRGLLHQDGLAGTLQSSFNDGVNLYDRNLAPIDEGSQEMELSYYDPDYSTTGDYLYWSMMEPLGWQIYPNFYTDPHNPQCKVFDFGPIIRTPTENNEYKYDTRTNQVS